VLAGLADGAQQIKWAITRVEEFSAPPARGAQPGKGEPPGSR
jgi:hypothetical protein